MPWREVEWNSPVCHSGTGVPSPIEESERRAGEVYECDICGKLWMLSYKVKGAFWYWASFEWINKK